MRAATGRSTLFGHKRAVIRATVLVASSGCAIAMAIGGGAVASASSARPAHTASRASVAGRAGSHATAPAAGVPANSWSSYLGGPLHTSYAPLQTSITPANATTLVQKWSQTAGAPYLASPTVVRGSVYVGGGNGWFYRLSESTGQVLAKVYLGYQQSLTCPYALGVTSTATYARNPRTHAWTVYVTGGDGYLYALKALTLQREWRAKIAIPSTKVNDYYDWSSPTVVNGKIYLGIASSCDRPLVRGAVVAYSQTTGAKLAERYMTPAGARYAGGTIWSTIAVAPNGDLFVTTGNGPYGRPRLRYSESILKMNPNTLGLLAKYQIPVSDVTTDSDFGGSPVLFGGYVGACNKNGIFYALRQSNLALVWKQRIGHASGAAGRGECLATPVYNGKDLYFGGNQTTLGGGYPGSVQERSAATGALIWATGLPGGVMGSPTMDGAGVIAVGTYSPGTMGVFLVNAATGAILEQLTSGGTFGQSVFAENQIFGATSNAVSAWDLPGG
jgi:outer membrane protein assembly factor BamB